MKRHPGRAWRRWRNDLEKDRVQRYDFRGGYLHPQKWFTCRWWRGATEQQRKRVIGIEARTPRPCSCHMCKRYGWTSEPAYRARKLDEHYSAVE